MGPQLLGIWLELRRLARDLRVLAEHECAHVCVGCPCAVCSAWQAGHLAARHAISHCTDSIGLAGGGCKHEHTECLVLGTYPAHSSGILQHASVPGRRDGQHSEVCCNVYACLHPLLSPLCRLLPGACRRSQARSLSHTHSLPLSYHTFEGLPVSGWFALCVLPPRAC